MFSIRLAVFALLAFGAYECQCANIQEPDSRALDIFVAAEHIIKIVKNIVVAVDSGIENSKPNVDGLINELTPELGKTVRKLYEEALAAVKRVEGRVDVIIKGVETLLKAIQGIKKCWDPEDGNVKKTIGELEDGLLKVVQKALKKHESSVNDVKEGFMKLLNRLRKLYDDEIKACTECVKPGHKNMQQCIEDELAKIEKGLLALVTDAFLFLSEIEEVVVDVGTEILKDGKPVTDDFTNKAKPIMKKISDCVAKM